MSVTDVTSLIGLARIVAGLTIVALLAWWITRRRDRGNTSSTEGARHDHR